MDTRESTLQEYMDKLPNHHNAYKRYKELLKAEKKLEALEAAGVDNWDGYEIAMEQFWE